MRAGVFFRSWGGFANSVSFAFFRVDTLGFRLRNAFDKRLMAQTIRDDSGILLNIL